jgi:hypothetical protein
MLISHPATIPSIEFSSKRRRLAIKADVKGRRVRLTGDFSFSLDGIDALQKAITGLADEIRLLPGRGRPRRTRTSKKVASAPKVPRRRRSSRQHIPDQIELPHPGDVVEEAG